MTRAADLAREHPLSIQLGVSHASADYSGHLAGSGIGARGCSTAWVRAPSKRRYGPGNWGVWQGPASPPADAPTPRMFFKRAALCCSLVRNDCNDASATCLGSAALDASSLDGATQRPGMEWLGIGGRTIRAHHLRRSGVRAPHGPTRGPPGRPRCPATHSAAPLGPRRRRSIEKRRIRSALRATGYGGAARLGSGPHDITHHTAHSTHYVVNDRAD
jgi:hypothetical protein